MADVTVPAPLLGTHVSIAGGIELAVARATAIGCRALQIFTRNASRWASPPLSDTSVQAFRHARSAAGILYVAAHSSYLINLASPDPQLSRRSLVACSEELERCRQLGLDALVIHPGAHTGSGTRAGLASVVGNLQELLRGSSGAVRILIENTAGQGTGLGASMEELAEILSRVNNDRLALCLDTCHAFAAGYDLSSAAGYHQLIERIDTLVGIDKLQLFHLNDSKTARGSRVDRHEHVGQGMIGVTGFRCLMQDARFARCAKILETPPGKDHCHDLENLALLRRLARPSDAE